MLECERTALEEMLLSCNLGLRRLMDIIALGQEVHIKARNDMLSLLLSLLAQRPHQRVHQLLAGI